MATTYMEDAEYLLLEEIMNYFESNIIFLALIDKKTNELSVEVQLFKKFGKTLSKNLSKNFIDINNTIMRGVIENKVEVIKRCTFGYSEGYCSNK